MLTPTGQATAESFSALSNRSPTWGMMNEHNVIYNVYRGEESRSIKVKQKSFATWAFDIFLLFPRLQLILYCVPLINIHVLLCVVVSDSGMTI